MAFEFFPDTTGSLPADAEPLTRERAGALGGIGRAIVTAPPRAALKAAETAHIIGTGIEPGLSPEERDAQFKRIEETYRPYIEALSPHSYDTGTSGEILGGFLEGMAALATRGGVTAMTANAELGTATSLVGQGVDSTTAGAAGLGVGISNALGFRIPFVGNSLTTKVLSGIGANVALGAGTDAWIGSMLESGGYGELAKQYDPYNAHARLLDAMIGGAFGGLAHHLEGGARLDSETADAVLQLNRVRQTLRDQLPGKPATPGDLNAHSQATDRATEQMAKGQPVDVADKLLGRRFADDPLLEKDRAFIRKLVERTRNVLEREVNGEIQKSDIPGQQTEKSRARALADGSPAQRGNRPTKQEAGAPGRIQISGEPVAPEIVKVADVGDMQAALEGSRVSSVGNTTTVSTERGTRVGVRYSLIEADKLRTSHTDELTPAKGYDQRMQPRDRDRAASEIQVARIAGKLDFERLAENPSAADGAPIIGPDDMVESGNARSIAIRRAYKSGQAVAYKQALIDRAAHLGLDPQAAAQMREPVLVRQRISSVRDRAAFALEANEQAQARMSLTEQARADASRIDTLEGLEANDDGSINMRDSQGFIRRFMGNIAANDHGAMVRPDGSLSSEGTARIRNAVFAKAYGDPDLVSMLVEGGDQNVRNVLTGLSRAAADMADIREGSQEGYYQPLDISGDVARAARLYAEIKRQGETVDGYLANGALFDPIPQLQLELLKAFDLHARSGRRIGEMLTMYADLVRRQGNPSQMGLMVVPETALSRESLLAEVAKELKPDQTRSTETGQEKPLADAPAEQDTTEGRQAAAVVTSNPDVMVAYDDASVLSGAEALAQAEAELVEAQHMAGLFDEVSSDITPETLNAAEGGVPYVEARRTAYNPDQISLDFTNDMPADAKPAEIQAASAQTVEQLARQPNELARRIAKGFKNTESAVLVGEKIRDVHDLAVLAQVYRNPLFETLRYVFVKGDKVIHATGVSSRQVGSTNLFASTKQKGAISNVETLSATIDALGADGVYMVHNHPSGNPDPSRADIELTTLLNAHTKGRILGHVVVNHKAYTAIRPDGITSLHKIDNKDLHTRPIDHPVLRETIQRAADIARIGSSMRDLKQHNSVILVGRLSNGEVSGIVELPLEFMKKGRIRLIAEARRYKLNSGARDIFIVGPDGLQESVKMRMAVQSDLLMDVVSWDGKQSMRASTGSAPGFANGIMEKPGARGGGQRATVQEDIAPYDGGKVPPVSTLSESQVQRMRGLVREKLRYLQSVKLRGFDPEINKLSDQELAREATRQASQEFVDEAIEKKRRVALATVSADRSAKIQDAHAEGKLRGLISMMVRDKGDRANSQSFEAREMAKRGWAMARLMPALQATKPRLFGVIEDKQGWRDLVREIYGEDTGNKAAKDGAKAWLGVMESLRMEANYAGFDIAKLFSYRLPQSHSRKALADVGAEKWIADILPKLDRDRYVNEMGKLFTDKELQDFLGQAYENIVTNGMNSLEPGAYRGNAALVNKYQEHRAIHFKRADDYVDYLASYGAEGSIHGVITGHVTRMARDIALVETFGPNPAKAFQVLLDRATLAGDKDQFQFTENLFHEISGATTPGEIPNWAEYSQGLRNLLVSSKLGSAAVSSVTDHATLHITAQVNNLSSMQTFRNQVAAFNPLTKADRDIARANGLGLDIFTQSLNRWGEEGLGTDITGRLAAGTLRLSGLNGLTEANKRAFGVTMMGGIGRLVKEKGFEALHEADNRILASKGITGNDWHVWKLAKLEDWGNGNDAMLTPQAIARIPDSALRGIKREGALPGSKRPEGMQGSLLEQPDIPPAILRNEAITKLLGAVLEETDNAVITTGYRERALLRQGTVKGTPTGELMRHITLFKSYPVAMITKHWSRALSMPTMSGKVIYASSLFTALTIMGAVAMSIKDVIAGKDPRSFKDPRSWLAAMAQGGGLGIYGDYLFSDQSRFGNSLVASLAGPTAGTVEDAYNLTAGNVHQAIRGERTHAGAEALRFAKGNTPLINLWYTKAALDRFILNDFQDYLSPGYLTRVRETTRKNTGQDYWWAPGENKPARSPDMSALTQ